MARQINRPQLGRPADSRVTREAIDADPRLAGVEPFDPAQDVDIIDEINTALIGVAADIDAAAGGAQTLDELNDVELAGAQDGQVLTRVAGTWTAADPAGGAGGGSFGGYVYGFGRGGDVVVGPGLPAPFDGWNASTNTLTLATDVSVRNLTIPTGATLRANGWRVFVSDTLTVNGALHNDGNDGGRNTNPTPTNWGSLGRGTGAQNVFNSLGGQGYNGWLVYPPEPGYAQGASPADIGYQLIDMSTNTWYQAQSTRTPINGGTGGDGGGSATLNGATAENGGGGGGGGVLLVAARTITGTGRISARGGKGGDGLVSGALPSTLKAKGGGGGGGGVLRVITANTDGLSATVSGTATLGGVTLSATGGLGGVGDNGGDAGGQGGAGTLEVLALS